MCIIGITGPQTQFYPIWENYSLHLQNCALLLPPKTAKQAANRASSPDWVNRENPCLEPPASGQGLNLTSLLQAKPTASDAFSFQDQKQAARRSMYNTIHTTKYYSQANSINFLLNLFPTKNRKQKEKWPETFSTSSGKLPRPFWLISDFT